MERFITNGTNDANSTNEIKMEETLLRVRRLLWFAAGAGALTLLYLLLLPSESGYSITRLEMMALVGVVSSAAAWAARRAVWLEKSAAVVARWPVFWVLAFLLGLGCALSLAFVIAPAYRTLSGLEAYGPLFFRALPLVLWGGALSAAAQAGLFTLRYPDGKQWKRALAGFAGILFFVIYLASIWLGALGVRGVEVWG